MCICTFRRDCVVCVHICVGALRCLWCGCLGALHRIERGRVCVYVCVQECMWALRRMCAEVRGGTVLCVV